MIASKLCTGRGFELEMDSLGAGVRTASSGTREEAVSGYERNWAVRTEGEIGVGSISGAVI